MPLPPRTRTFLASPERTDPVELAHEAAAVRGSADAHLALELLDEEVLILDRNRQIVAVGARLAEALGLDRVAEGRRPGEAFGCVHAAAAPAGCGTSPECAGCGALLATLTAQELREPATEECRLLTVRKGALESRELRVRATPISVGGRDLTAVVLHDISAEKRRELLERSFLHDFGNLVGALQTWARVAAAGGASGAKALERIAVLSDQMGEELARHRSLLDAERGDLAVSLEEIRPGSVLEKAGERFPDLDVRADGDGRPFVTDPGLLARVLGNMVKNAFEASAQAGEPPRLSYSRAQGAPSFAVWNAGAIPDAVAHGIFHRSFSTKGPGRGIGTYSMKLFGETYLGGKVSFTSSPASGTTFTIALPPGGPTRRARSAG